jgi:hypothetical protein
MPKSGPAEIRLLQTCSNGGREGESFFWEKSHLIRGVADEGIYCLLDKQVAIGDLCVLLEEFWIAAG